MPTKKRSELVRYTVGEGSPRNAAEVRTYVAYRTLEDNDWAKDQVYTYRVATGGRERGIACVLLTADVDPGNHAKPIELLLASLHHYSGCTTPDLDRHTTVYLVRAAIQRVFRLLPMVTQGVVLQDESYNLCGLDEASWPKSAQSVSLAEHNMMVHGDTWYTRKLGAEPDGAASTACVAAWKAHVASSVGDRDAAAIEKELRSGMTREERRLIRDALLRTPPLATWQAVYTAINAHPGGCQLFGKLSESAKRRAGLPPIRGQIFRIPSETVRSWQPEPELLKDEEVASDASGGGRGRGRIQSPQSIVDRAWSAVAALESTARRQPFISGRGNA